VDDAERSAVAADLRPAPSTVALVGLQGGSSFGPGAAGALRSADTIIGTRRHLAVLPADVAGNRVALTGSLTAVLDDAALRADQGEHVVVLTSGDPGFFGLVRLARERLGAQRLVVHPAPSSISLAFARLGEAWDDARIVSAHGRPLSAAVTAILARGPGRDKVAVLVSPDQPPQALAAALLAAGAGDRRASICSQLGTRDEVVVHADLATVAAQTWDPLSVLVLRAPNAAGDPSTGSASPASLGWEAQGTREAPGTERRWGAPEADFVHRAGMITKAEVRAVALGKLSLPTHGVVWDLGAGSGAVSAEIAALVPSLTVFAVEQDEEDVARIEQNVAGLGVTVVHGVAPAALADLPDPDRVFVGGGGPAVLDAALARLRPGGTIVATYAALERAAVAGRRLGQLVQLSVSRGRAFGADGALRLQAENPVFICWGPA
jgi:precorrin-6Y C5,15-methyltransferase (decarboxylating)